MIDYIEIAYNICEITIDEDTTLLETIQKTNRHTMKKQKEIMKGVEDMLNPTLELKHKQIAREAEISMLMEMKIEGIPKQAIIRIAKRQNIPEEVKKILDSQE